MPEVSEEADEGPSRLESGLAGMGLAGMMVAAVEAATVAAPP